ncbi:anthranilate phosphoribosyltransferase [Emcibacter nanhaiensis]|uniref:Anthranilate phosphoribosyltransferase n=1 Tax=Emcibacter nanhaiensis TaxID=1505037 RepID=A0A501PSI6_9PROT|nr:anthranilate phosphoribosyltransferase [Emcibacter nanhaiensis]TPD62924.1 anthranilate phosphoribosyltransferase [Emcibacter nanhaiensis]
MSFEFKQVIDKIARGLTLNREESRQSFEYMMSGDATGPQIGAFLMGLRVRGETVDEITGAAEVMRAKASAIQAPEGAIDTCGTGGDGASTYNISTAAAIVIAACGVPVAKHGNRAMSSKSGSADVLETLGINIEAELDVVEKCIRELGIGFLMATRHHSAMRHVGPARASLGTRTIFNLLGPLANPAGTKRQVIGVFDKKWLRPMAEVLGQLGSEHVWVVHGSDGLDELTITGPSYVAEYKNGTVSEFEVSPEDIGLSTSNIESIRGGDAKYNAAALKQILAGEKNAYRDIVLLNSAAALVVADKATDLKAGAELAAQALDSGVAEEKLQQWIKMSNS